MATEKAGKVVAQLNLTEKATFVTGKLSIGVAPCIGNILPIDHAGFKGICMQDGPNGINIADLVSVFPAGLTSVASWDKDLLYKRAYALGEEFRGKGINIALGYVSHRRQPNLHFSNDDRLQSFRRANGSTPSWWS